ncbi:hypothetical protein [Paenibacillus humicus]|uniref:hypothetical protein n=1 Tax=Paenibacillus humicus TaxID=412861 RepID=UPI000FDA5B89|nr:hypothetical protein [Paenibacillus humicus]
MAIELNVLFKALTKDDKKEVLKFEIKGTEDEQGEADLFDLSGSIVVFGLQVGGDYVVQNMKADFLTMQRDSKKTVLKFEIKGEPEKAQALYPFAGRNVSLEVAASQMTIEEFREPHEGVKYKVGPDGTTELQNDKNQLTIDEVAAAAEDPMHDVDDPEPF